MKHFCFLTGSYQRNDVLMFDRQGKSLVEAGFKVSFVTCDNYPNETIDGIEFISSGFQPVGRFDQFLHTKRPLLQVAKEVDADIYQISDPELISIVVPLKKMGKHVIFNMREYYPKLLQNKTYIPKPLRKTVARGYEFLMKRYLKRYDAVFVVTDYMVDLLKQRFGVCNCLLLTNFPRIQQDAVFTYDDYLKRGDVLCYAGTIYKRSRQENVFDALKSFPSVHYVLAGKIEEGYDGIKLHDYWGQIEFIDGFTLKEQKEIFKRATIANVFRDFGPNHPGSLGVIKIFEAMGAALPVLMAKVPLYKRIIEKYNCGLCVDPNDSKSIEKAINFMIENKHEAYEMGQRGRQAVIEEYNWENEAKKYINKINQLVLNELN